MNNKLQTGKMGEDLACDYLTEKGYSVIERNLRQKWGELDIIAKDPNGTLVFVEVKTLQYYSEQAIRQSGNSANKEKNALKPEDNLTKSKLTKLQRMAEVFAGKHPELIIEERGWRIDLIAVTMFAGKHPVINHYENI